MTRETLLDFFDDVKTTRGEFLVFDDGFRTRSYSYRDVARAAEMFASRLCAAGLTKGDKVVIWGENRPEWIAALWGCILAGVIAVPIDFRTSSDFLLRVRTIVGARVLVIGEDVQPPEWPADLDVWRLSDLTGPATAQNNSLTRPGVNRDDVVEIIFTSGATGEPKGVVITHRNLLANIVPIETEVKKYLRSYAWAARPLFPIRFLNLLPLSHLFGQSLATFVPPMLAGTVVFMRGYNPGEIVRQVRSRRISVLVCVPKMLDVLREHVRRVASSATLDDAPGQRWYQRWWQHRDVHRLLGWKFWSFVVGAAPLDPGLEEFWTRMGYLVSQGYGLTETAPIVTLNHPFASHKGSVGKPIHGVEVTLAADGEILVRGENVTRGYYGATEASTLDDGWLHTGDIGEVDAEGRVYIRGRKKEMIVTPEGLNVFPEDVERVLVQVPGVRDAAVVGRTQQGEERVHAVLVVAPGTDPEHAIQTANADLADHQRVRSVSVWPSPELPRTDGTRKLKRREVKAWVESNGSVTPKETTGSDRLEAVISQFRAGTGDLRDSTPLEALGLTSLEHVELLMALEHRYQVSIDEAAFGAARTVGDLRALVAAPAAVPDTPRDTGQTTTREANRAALNTVTEVVNFPRWNRGPIPRAIRRASYPTWLLPLLRVFASIRVEGLEHLGSIEGAVVFASNHQSHLDAPVILAALPPRLRYRMSIAMAKEFFKAHFFPEQFGRKAWLTNSLNYYLAAMFFGAFPLPQREAGTRETLRYIGELVGDGFSVLIFPEGKRTDGGEINTFRSGIGMIGARLDVPIVPVRLIGLDRILHHSWRMAAPGRATVRFGAPMRLEGSDYAALTRQVEDAVRNL